MTTILDHALQYAQRGFAVFPIVPRGKIPLTDHGFKDATKDLEQIKVWWAKWPVANIGVATGRASGFWVLDIDGIEGEASLKVLEVEIGALTPTVEVITGGGGRHLYYAMPTTPGIDISNSVSKLGPHLDIRGDGGYIVAPPSIHPSGRCYEWSIDIADNIMVASDGLIAKVTRSDQPLKSKTSVTDWMAMLQDVLEGYRNDTLARLTGKLLGGGLDPYISFYLLLCWNDARCKPPLSYEEFSRTFMSIATLEGKKRGVR